MHRQNHVEMSDVNGDGVKILLNKTANNETKTCKVI
jgi:hypothetical protein